MAKRVYGPAGLLLAVVVGLVVGRYSDGLFASSAQAAPRAEPRIVRKVNKVSGFPVTSLGEVVVLGDGRSFVVTNPKGFVLYHMDTSGNVSSVGGYEVDQLKSINVLGDGKSFVVSNPNGFMIYRMDETRL